MRMVCRNSNGRNKSPLPEILEIDLGNSHIEPVSQFLLQRKAGMVRADGNFHKGETQF